MSVYAVTDTMYNPAKAPLVSHFEGNTLFQNYIEAFVCPTVTSNSNHSGESFHQVSAASWRRVGKEELPLFLLCPLVFLLSKKRIPVSDFEAKQGGQKGPRTYH